MNTRRILLPALISSLSLGLWPAGATDWPNLRGPEFTGSSPETGLPAQLDPDKNLRWKVDMPGNAASTPAVVGDKIFVSSTNLDTRVLEAMCLDLKTGEELWRREVAEGYQQDDRSNFASPSPASDGEIVVFFYGTGDLVAFTLDGEELWARNIQRDYGQFAFLWTFSTSPLLHGGKLYLPVLQRDTAVSGRGKPEGNPSYLLALEPKSGEELWRVERDSDSVSESRESFSTPQPVVVGGQTQIVVAGADCLTGHDAETGKELWRSRSWNPEKITHWRLVPSPLAVAGIAVIPAPKGEPVYAFSLEDGSDAWVSDPSEASSDVSSAAYAEGAIFLIDGDRAQRAVVCLDPATGAARWRLVLDSRAKIEASATVADGKIYLIDHSGKAFVVSTSGELLDEVELGARGDKDTRSTVVVAHGSVLVRTNSSLFCFE